jgi:hypothetical protein
VHSNESGAYTVPSGQILQYVHSIPLHKLMKSCRPCCASPVIPLSIRQVQTLQLRPGQTIMSSIGGIRRSHHHAGLDSFSCFHLWDCLCFFFFFWFVGRLGYLYNQRNRLQADHQVCLAITEGDDDGNREQEDLNNAQVEVQLAVMSRG